MASATPHAVSNECVEAIQEEGPMMPYLPCGIISDILLRLPAECIFQLWQKNDLLCHLTTTPCFKRAHIDGATPDIVVQSLNQQDDSDIKLFLFDGKDESTVATSLAISSFNEYCGGQIDLWSSYEGFLIFQSTCSPTPVLCILNPVTKEQVIVTSPHNFCYVCGFYFHPRKKEYQVICVRNLDGEQIWEFEILSLRTKHKRSVGSSSYPPSTTRRPVLIHGIFYWMVNGSLYSRKNGVYPSGSILSFNIETEELRTIEVVMPSSELKPADMYQKLFELEGDLCLFDHSSSVIWVFNNTTKRWDKKHSIPSPDSYGRQQWGIFRNGRKPDGAMPRGGRRPTGHHWEFHDYFTDVEYIQTKGEFIAYHQWDEERPSYIYNLRLGTWKLLERTGFKDYTCIAAVNYTPSLVYMDVADPVIPL